jgi:RHS repeat-associated protein
LLFDNDAKIGQQYLRARYYDPATGRFNRLDPFFGNLNNPRSLHKYLYTHADPVNMNDPMDSLKDMLVTKNYFNDDINIFELSIPIGTINNT